MVQKKILTLLYRFPSLRGLVMGRSYVYSLLFFISFIPIEYLINTCNKYFLFKCLLDSPEITSYLLQSMAPGKLHSGSNGPPPN